MVSSLRYKSLKKVSFFRSMKFNKLVGLILVLGLIATEPYILLFLVFSVYVVSGIVLFLSDHVLHKEKQETPVG
jgi:CDP-diacylglycerol--serine O-phosphatidyltransferase